MLYIYENKIYVKPFSNKIVEVKISKKNNEFDLKPTKNIIEITEKVKSKMSEVSLEKAYELINRSKDIYK